MAEDDSYTHPQQISSEDFAPDHIGPYKIEGLLNKGGMSFLYLASDTEKGTPVTIKVLSKKFMSHPEVVKRFLTEAEIISMTDHPNIIKLLGHGEWEGGLYIAMEYIEGISLRKYLQQTPLSLKRALGIILDIAYALCHLHVHGVIHRDLKPENILVTEEGEIKVIDFGISQLLTEKDIPLEPPRPRWLGTPVYISPEQKENPENVSFPSDIYSLGIVAYELILGKLSHGHVHLSLMPKGMQHILIKCLQTNPAERYQDIVEFIADVSAYLNSSMLQKEKMIGDHLSEILEEFRQVQKILAPHAFPQCKGLEIGAAQTASINMCGIYYDFFSMGTDSCGVILAESSKQGTEGFASAAVFMGMAKAMVQLKKTPEQVFAMLNEMLIQDPLKTVFNATFLAINIKDNLLRCISCGLGSIWRIPASTNLPENYSRESLPLGISKDIEFKESTFLFEPGDSCIIHTFAAFNMDKDERRISLECFSSAIKETISCPPQEQAERIIRKMKVSTSVKSFTHPHALVSLRREKIKE